MVHPLDIRKVWVCCNLLVRVDQILLTEWAIECNKLVIFVVERLRIWPGVIAQLVGIRDNEPSNLRTLCLSKHVAEVLLHVKEPEANLSVVQESVLVVGDCSEIFESFFTYLDFTNAVLVR